MRSSSAENVLERLKIVLDAASDSALARAMNTSPQTISSWKTRDSVPYAKCVQICEESRVSLDWLLTGQGSTYRNEAGQAAALTPRQTALLELFNALDSEGQREIQAAAEKQKHLIELEERVSKLEACGADSKKMA